LFAIELNMNHKRSKRKSKLKSGEMGCADATTQ
jgi:hypothetical protein